MKTSSTRTTNSACSVEGCDTQHYAKTFCNKHYWRFKRHGDPTVVTPRFELPSFRGEDHPSHKGDEVGYFGAHNRVRALMGQPHEHECVDCGEPAEEWSYNHSDPAAQTQVVPGGSRLVYSPDPSHYRPRCRYCHRQYDKAGYAAF